MHWLVDSVKSGTSRHCLWYPGSRLALRATPPISQWGRTRYLHRGWWRWIVVHRSYHASRGLRASALSPTPHSTALPARVHVTWRLWRTCCVQHWLPGSVAPWRVRALSRPSRHCVRHWRMPSLSLHSNRFASASDPPALSGVIHEPSNEERRALTGAARRTRTNLVSVSTAR